MNKSLEELKSMADAAVKENLETAWVLNDDLAAHPEISGEEYHACESFCSILEGRGISVERRFGGLPTAFRAAVRTEPDSPVRIGILAEYDALPGIGHGCGHCASGSISLLTALALHRCQKELTGNIDLIGTPDEEVNGSKAEMARQGLFDDYSYVIMLHMNNKNLIKMNFIALAGFHFNFKGCPAHASACPWEGRNALNGAMLMIHGMDMMRQHLRPDTRIHGIITHGGDAGNVVPEYVTTDYTVRHPESPYLNEVVRMVFDCAKGAAQATQTEVEIDEYSPRLDNLKPNEAGEELLRGVFEQVGIPLYTKSFENKGSSDIGNVSFRCPAFHPALAVTDDPVPLHTREFAALMTERERILPVLEKGARVIACMILTTLAEPQTMAAIRRDFLEES